jgi:hypothetical protein
MQQTHWKSIALVLAGVLTGCAAARAHDLMSAIPDAQAKPPVPRATATVWAGPPSTAWPSTSSSGSWSYGAAALPGAYSANPTAPKWELHCASQPFDTDLTLQRYGAAGWELVGPGEHDAGLCFKRPAP